MDRIGNNTIIILSFIVLSILFKCWWLSMLAFLFLEDEWDE